MGVFGMITTAQWAMFFAVTALIFFIGAVALIFRREEMGDTKAMEAIGRVEIKTDSLATNFVAFKNATSAHDDGVAKRLDLVERASAHEQKSNYDYGTKQSHRIESLELELRRAIERIKVLELRGQRAERLNVVLKVLDQSNKPKPAPPKKRGRAI